MKIVWKTLAVLLSLGIGVAVLLFVQEQSMKDAPPYKVERVSAEVVEVTPVGHRRYTSYAVELKLPDGRVVFKDWDNPPSGKAVYLYTYVDNDGYFHAEGQNPNDDYKTWLIAGWIGAGLAGAFALAVALAITLGTLGALAARNQALKKQKMVEEALRRNPSIHKRISARR